MISLGIQAKSKSYIFMPKLFRIDPHVHNQPTNQPTNQDL